MVVVYHFAPGLNVEEKVLYVAGIVASLGSRGYVGALLDNGVEAPDNNIMGMGHLGRDVDVGMVILETD